MKNRMFSILVNLVLSMLLLSGCLKGEFEMLRQGKIATTPAITQDNNTTTTECHDPDLSIIAAGQSVTRCNGSTAVGTYAPAACANDGDTLCMLPNGFVAAKTSLLQPGVIARGETIGGVAGTLRATKLCRNTANLTLMDAVVPSVLPFTNISINDGADTISFDGSRHELTDGDALRFTTTDELPGGLSPATTYYARDVTFNSIKVSLTLGGAAVDLTADAGNGTHFALPEGDSLAQYFDTIDDFNNGGGLLPPDNPFDTSCTSVQFTDTGHAGGLAATNDTVVTYASAAFSELWQDMNTGLYFTNILYDGGNNTNWPQSIKLCATLNGGSAGNHWRLPTQKELLQLYVNGISRLTLAGGDLNKNFWSSTASSAELQRVWYVNLATGSSGSFTRDSASQAVICVKDQ